ncbi:MAG TPA: ATP-binding protein [Kofleriaceae bacterium]|nr:ATP-binding protein [Kofleriaceae bacterium]
MSEPSRPLVLYVDDERANRVVFEQSLGTDFAIETAADGASALALMSSREVAVLVTDMRMPGMTGEELLRIAKERHPRAIRIVITAYADIDPILRAINEGLVARYIIKPWQRAELVQILRWACEAWSFAHDSASLHQRLIEVERLATLGNIASALVHDLKTPLMSILANAEHIGELAKSSELLRTGLEHIDGIPPARRRELYAMIADLGPVSEDLKTSTWHLDELVNRIRVLGRPNDGRATPTTWSDPLPIVRHAMAVCQPLAITGRASISYDGPTALPRVRIPPTELTQVLINVVANGAQAVAARGKPHGSVAIHANERAGMLELQVEDDGVGMSRDTLDRIGTPFFTTRPEGTGLGIAQCQRLVGTAGGRFLVASELGKGTVVTILLPTQ